MADLIKHSGQVFTPDYIVRMMLDEAGYYGERILRRHCMENSCGDGAFLCEIIRRYCSAFYSFHKSYEGLAEELKTYIHGIEMESEAYKCCLENISAVFKSLSLSGCSVDLLNADTLRVDVFNGKMDYVIGNPPYVRVHNLEDNFTAVKSFFFANGGMTDMYLVFFELGFRMLKAGGRLCYITPSSWLNSVAGANLRQYVRCRRNLVSVIDLEHYQAFHATTYTMVSFFVKDESLDTFGYNVFNGDTLDKDFVERLSFAEIDINGCFYLARHHTLHWLKNVLTSTTPKYVSVKNGFATLADKVFINDSFPFTDFVIPVIKASTGKWKKAFFPYGKNGKPFAKHIVFDKQDVAEYLETNKDKLIKGQSETMYTGWYLYGRTQALKDVFTVKIAVNTTLKDLRSIKINLVPAGIAPTLVAMDMHGLFVADGDGLRRLTLREGLRLFGYPESFKFDIERDLGYDLLGNTVVVPVIKAVALRTLEKIIRQ